MSETVRRGIPTVYAGIEFRSRLEARWAAFFDQLGWQWTYEPLDGDYYIPDFLVHLDDPVLVEVKPAATARQMEGYRSRIERSMHAHWDGMFLIVGLAPGLVRPDALKRMKSLGLITRLGHQPWWDTAVLTVERGLTSSIRRETDLIEWSEWNTCGGAYSPWVNVHEQFTEGAWRAATNASKWRAA